jgi:RNA polymerase sigma factor (TIGR02999 family)
MRNDVPKSQEPTEPSELPPTEELLPLVYEELRKIAAHKMAQEAPGQTLQPTALVHEAWLRLGADGQPPWRNRAHFFAAAAEAMRQILVERARRHTALKRGGGVGCLSLDEVEIPMAVADDEMLLAVDEALEKFAARDPRKAELVKLRYFIGMSFEEAASVLGIAVPTAKKWWAYGRAWLTVALRPSLEVSGPLSPSAVRAGPGGEKNV